MFDRLAQDTVNPFKHDAQFLQDRAFVDDLFRMRQDRALAELQVHVASLDDSAYKIFRAAVWVMIANAQQTLQGRQSGDSPAHGSSCQDQLACIVAHIDIAPDRRVARQAAQQRIDALQMVLSYAQQFRG